MLNKPATDALDTSVVDEDVASVVSLKPDPSVLSAIGRGHSLNSAIADLIDNSIDAGAERISIRFMVDSGLVKSIRIADDGTGMNSDQLIDAMTLGKQRKYDADSLGHFGMGLKAASMSQGACLRVFTSCGYEAMHGVRMLRNDVGGNFDIEVLTESAAWTGYHLGTHRGIQSTGTVVEWSILDAVSVAAAPSVRQKWLDGLINDLRGELGLTFHRPIAEGALRIEIDEFDIEFSESGAPRTVESVDPFGFNHSGRTGYPKTIAADLPDGGVLSAKCHILPPNSQAPAAKLLGKPRIDGQGLYIYRNGRMLQAGGWHSLLPDHRTESQLARVSIDISKEMLSAIAINPEKRGVVLRPEFMHALEAAIADDETDFRQYLEHARETMQAANVRRVGPKPITALGAGLSDATRSLVQEMLVSRDDSEPASIRWRVLDDDRLFQFDHRRRTLWMNAGYRAALTGSDGLSLSIYLLVEKHFASERPQQSTLDQLEAWQRVLALTTIAEIGAKAFDPTVAEPDDADALPVFAVPDDNSTVSEDEAQAPESEMSGPESHGQPTPADIDRVVSARIKREVAQDAEQAALQAAKDEARNARYAREAARGELTDDGERMQLIPNVLGASDDLVLDLRQRLNDFPLLSADQEVSLAKEIEAGLFAQEQLDLLDRREQRSPLGREFQWVAKNGEKAFARFAASNYRLVFSIARRYVNHGLDYADLIQEGAFGLLRAIQKFDYMKGFKFSTYATWWVRQAITRALADQGRTIRIPVHMVEQQSKLRQTARSFELQNDREPTISELAAAAEVTEQEAASALGYEYSFFSIDKELDPGEGFGSFHNTLIDESVAPVDLLIHAEFRGSMNNVLSALPKREATTIQMRFGIGGQDPATLDHIGDIFGVTRERIRQIEKKTMESLRSSTEVRGHLEDFLDAELDREGSDLLEPFRSRPRAFVATPPVPLGKGPSSQAAARIEAPEPEAPDQQVPIELGSDAHIVDLYRQGWSLAAIEAEAEVDIRYVATRLSKVVLALNGAIDDESLAPRHGLAWEPAERERIFSAYRKGTGVSRIAHDQGRTQLAIAWQLLDSPRRPVVPSKKLVRRLRGDHASRLRPEDTGAG
ncbi:sigma-70 family RNA polymerase sigma factor [Salinibacterium sp. NSLL150]|uniref:sigma-70 family RNA polymerase sigma factor n=1 Tax=unclassified Salinibacterium TaxID=2632331 RepID=UPI0018CF053A|nr:MULTISPECIES: sigma-70 family RNA polymerase sigma factor [unclassified Salinibacterium]MBH0097616.1 sigma-70 family RNA polymerase sigma factor [Salinibacterium sp. NSLL35]MBH0100371.1 sigma-70 family RNA polymerase sigma factor [Salinibacterium sp. NSLL150]MBH0103130.1 sigma-70 family RNA polymerase sigma factor [Salinibacterium sp. NSLL16]MBH0105891.1 sigma-70 family RNA polymerase sigma factor [Salinibacterium sp. NSLL17]